MKKKNTHRKQAKLAMILDFLFSFLFKTPKEPTPQRKRPKKHTVHTKKAKITMILDFHFSFYTTPEEETKVQNIRKINPLRSETETNSKRHFFFFFF